MDTRSFSLGRRRQRHHLEICFVWGSNSRVYGRVDFRDPPSHTTSSVIYCCQLLLLWKYICLICYGSWRPLGKAFLRRIYLLYTNSHRQLLLISNRLWAFLLLEWPFPSASDSFERFGTLAHKLKRKWQWASCQACFGGSRTYRSRNYQISFPIRQAQQSISDNYIFFPRIPAYSSSLLARGTRRTQAKEGFWDWACISTSVLDGSYIN